MTLSRQSTAFALAFFIAFYDPIANNCIVVSALVSSRKKGQQIGNHLSKPIDDNMLRPQSDTIIHVGNLDWKLPIGDVSSRIAETITTASDKDNNEKNRQITQDSFEIKVAELPVPVRKRDEGKFHRGSAKVTFSSALDARLAMDALQRCTGPLSDETGAKNGWKVRWDFVPQSSLEKEKNGSNQRDPCASPEQQTLLEQHRRIRAEKYARKRKRVGESTDRALQSLLAGLSPTDRGTILSQTPVLEAQRLEWSVCPEEIDPMRGGRIRRGTQRGERKRAAVEAFLAVVSQVLAAILVEREADDYRTASPGSRRDTVADLGCGAGNLTIPLAWWLKQLGFGVLGVDINEKALWLLSKRANVLGIDVGTLNRDLLELSLFRDPSESIHVTTIDQGNELSGCVAVVSLHACGAASDLSMAVAVRNNLPFAISPCCIGKIGTERTPTGRMPPKSLTSAQRSAAPSNVSYPRSTWMRGALPSPADYRLLAAAADYSVGLDDTEVDDRELARRRRCRLSKKVIEIDRLQWAKENGYYIRLLEMPRIGPLYPKRELLLGAKEGSRAALKLSQLPAVY